jgi:hypothetical protein
VVSFEVILASTRIWRAAILRRLPANVYYPQVASL